MPDLPYNDFAQLLCDLNSGKARLLRFSFAMESSLFSLIASSAQKVMAWLGTLIGFGGILAAIAFAFIYSFWFLLAIPVLFSIGKSLTKNAYNSAVFDAAVSSEPAFCFLYYAGQVSVEDAATNEQYYFHHA